ncbi:MAG: Mur ligase family protein [Aquabacterium sp.]
MTAKLRLPATDLADATVLVLGLGASGLAMARWCDAQGARVRIWDTRDTPPLAAALAEQVPAALRVGGAADPALLEGCTRLLKSPGLAPGDARIAPLLAAARARGMPVQGELVLFNQALAALKAERGYAPRLLAVTGTNGKTTTVNMLALLARRAGQSVALAGNVGPTLLDTLATALHADTLPALWVLELSSFQLDGVDGFEPDAAAVLNLTQDHLDWHGDMASYGAAKARVAGLRATLVIDRDDAGTEAHVLPAVLEPPIALATSARGKTARLPALEPRRIVGFGLGPPREPGDFGLVEEAGMAWLVRALPRDEPAQRRRGGAPLPQAALPLDIQRLMPADALRVRGRHNAANALAALALATAVDLPLAPMLHGLREYAGEPHRVALVGSVGGVEAFDDSKGTNVGATVAALNGLGADKAPARLAVILGGDGKGQDFAPLAAPLARHARAVAFIGRDGAVIETAVRAALQEAGVAMARPGPLPQAVDWCFEQARPGDAVLLSPACASLDQFRDYGHRAEVFVAAVQARAALAGEVVG